MAADGARGRPTLVIMVKLPRPGRVKTRLAREIGGVAATWWFRHQVARLLRRVGRDPRWRTVLAVAPDRAAGARDWPPGVARMAQGGGDLGQRMARALAGCGAGPVLVIGADIPGVTAGRVAGALAALRGRDAVLGPAPDGGYWLIGLRRGAGPLPRGLFRGVRWSSAHALADTAATMADLSIGRAATLADVDTARDLSAAGRA